MHCLNLQHAMWCAGRGSEESSGFVQEGVMEGPLCSADKLAEGSQLGLHSHELQKQNCNQRHHG